jgi:glycosyltransferase involved in cell wall biosynthesis
MASKTPFATVGCGNAEEIVDWSHGGVLVSTNQRPDGMVDAEPEAMARAIEDLILNPDQRRHLAESGYRAWLKRFTWERIAAEYERLYKSILSMDDRKQNAST